jgi:hypothetical protein
MVVAAGSASPSARAAGPPPRTITVMMEDGKVVLPPVMAVSEGVLSLIWNGYAEKRVKRGTVRLDGQSFTLYMSPAKEYPLKNKGGHDGYSANTSTMIAVDQRGNGKPGNFDVWYANLPIRLGDRMFEVAEIAEKGTRVTLLPSRAPLRGVVVGQPCPGFSFETADGRKVTRETYKGKAFLLDIWSVT